MSEEVAFGELPHRSVYRVRSSKETEPAVATVDGIQQIRQARLRSIRSIVHASITFKNLTDKQVRVVWLDFSGNEVVYSAIDAHDTRRYRTFATHPWIIRDVESANRMMINKGQVIFGEEKDQVAEIREAPLLEWTEEVHRHFPESFRETVKCILLCHLQQREVPKKVITSSNNSSNSVDHNSACEASYRRRVSSGMQQVKKSATLLRDETFRSIVEGTCFGDLPREIVTIIIQALEKPQVRQDLDRKGEDAAPSIEPVMLPVDVELTKFIPTEFLQDEE